MQAKHFWEQIYPAKSSHGPWGSTFICQGKRLRSLSLPDFAFFRVSVLSLSNPYINSVNLCRHISIEKPLTSAFIIPHDFEWSFWSYSDILSNTNSFSEMIILFLVISLSIIGDAQAGLGFDANQVWIEIVRGITQRKFLLEHQSFILRSSIDQHFYIRMHERQRIWFILR